MDYIVRLFRRETLSTDFIPVIDGLRFLAILMVVLFHINVYVSDTADKLGVEHSSFFPLPNILAFGHQGVQLFFVISGFVLALPFLRHGLGLTDKQISLKGYFLRRLTRLEPPYIICIIFVFLLRIFVISDRYSNSDLTVSLFSSLFYISNFIFPGELPHINNVTWSLEIEVQFYIVAPFIVGALCLIKNKTFRRATMLALIAGTAIFSWLLADVLLFPVTSLPLFLQYFFGGILLCDIFLLDSDKLGKINNAAGFIAGLVLLIIIISFEHAGSANPLIGHPDPFIRIISPLLIIGFYLTVFGNAWWNRVFSFNVLTLIGGMCYSIYLLHWVIISGVGQILTRKIAVSNYYTFFAAQFFVSIFVIVIISAIYYLLIEKPCMKRDWYIKLYKRLKNFTASNTLV